MTGIETNFQLKAWKRRIEQLAQEISEAAQAIPESIRQDRMIEAFLTLNRVADKLDFARAIPGDAQETPLLLKLSIQEHRERAARQRCEEVGSNGSPQMETADSLKVSRFPKPETLNQHGE